MTQGNQKLSKSNPAGIQRIALFADEPEQISNGGAVLNRPSFEHAMSHRIKFSVVVPPIRVPGI
jgi:hypothetical protein